MKRTKAPSLVTEDGRQLGIPVKNLVPKEYQDVIPNPASWTNPNEGPKRIDKWRNAAHKISRTLMPLAMEPDGPVDVGLPKKVRLNGLSQNRFNVLIAAMRSGMAKSSACKLAGISTTTLNKWEKLGSQGQEPYVAVYAFLEQVKAEFEKKLLDSIITAGTTRTDYVESVTERTVTDTGGEIEKTRIVEKVSLPKWAAAAWLLERRNPEYRLENKDEEKPEQNTAEEDLLLMDGTSLGLVEENE